MSERNRIANGRFLHNLNNWTSSGASYSAGAGDDHYGVAVLSTGGDYISQNFSVVGARAFTLGLAVYAVGADLSGANATLEITDGDGNTVTTKNLTGTADTWTSNEYSLGLAEGTTYTLKITNAGANGDVYIDDVWLWFVPITRAQIATRVAEKLGRLASDRSLSNVGSGSKTEGDYTYAIDAALRNIGAINPETGNVDIRYVEASQVDTALTIAETEMMERLHRDYIVEVDTSIGSRSESLSQKAEALSGMINGAGGGSRKMVTRKMRYK